MHQVLEHQEHATHAAEHGSKHAALLVAALAALLAITEQQAKHAEIKVETNAILAADAWDQYQGKSTRQLMADDMALAVAVLEPSSDSALSQKRAGLVKQLHDDAERFARDPKDGKEAISVRAHEFEAVRSEALEKAHSFDNAAALFELGIVLATASAIIGSRLLIRFAVVIGALGLAFAVLGLTYPELGAL